MLVWDLIRNFAPKTKFELVTHWVVDYINDSIDEEIVTTGIVSQVPIERVYLLYYEFSECWIENDTLFISQEVVQEDDDILKKNFSLDISCKHYLFSTDGCEPYCRDVSEDEFNSALDIFREKGYSVVPEKSEYNDDIVIYWAEKVDDNFMPVGDSIKIGVIETVYS